MLKFTAALFAVSALAGASTDALAAKKDNAAICPDPNRSPLRPGDIGKDLDVTGDCTVEAGTYKYGEVTIKAGGSLNFKDAKIDFTGKSIVIEKDGALLAGSESQPIGSAAATNRVVIRLFGDRPAVPMDHSSHADDCSMVDKGIGVMSGGTLRLIGVKGVPSRGGVSWTHLKVPAGPDTYADADGKKGIGAPVVDGLQGRRIVVAKDVASGPSAWQAEDWIVVATTSFSPFESEFVQIERMDPAPGGGTAITLKTALKHYHFGGSDPGPATDPSLPVGAASASFKAGKDKNYGVDERAEVGLVSRSIQLTATVVDAYTSPNDPGRNWGGETKICKGFKEATLEGVEIEKFGKEALGSYPIHFHMVGAFDGKQRVNANSVHHSYNKCATIHSSNNVAFENNVCARITGHAFYQEIGDEVATRFVGNLGVGVMNNNFGLPPGSKPESTTGWWEGDYLARSLGYTGLDIRNHDAQLNPVHGSCYTVDGNNGALIGQRNPKPDAQEPKPCDQKTASNPEYYFEPPTGFWIINPSAVLEGNSIAGCQGLGRGYWYLPPANYQPPGTPTLPPAIQYTQKFQPVGKFRNNRVHGCYDGIFGEPEEPVGSSEQLFPKVAGNPDGYNLIGRFEGFTASRIRNRAIWMRPMWFAFENARVATSREGVSLVTSGGLDGNAPGAWGLLKHAVVVALSTNNVDRWGPCADKAGGAQEFPGCVDRSVNAKDRYIKSYPSPAWNFAGFYIYDGPVRIHDTRFVRFRRSLTKPTSLLTSADETILKNFASYYGIIKEYEGDAALGWFQNNQSAYPTATEVLRLTFEETDLRHQVFTDKVNFGNFDDGDKNTAVIDRDGSLTGFRVLDKDGKPAIGHHPISLNNLPFNASSNAADECFAEGMQDEKAEGRPTSLISPGNMATLEFGALSGTDGLTRGALDNGSYRLTQFITFTKDSVDYGEHQSMTLHSRNNLGIWEPKVTSGLGYTVTVASASGKYPTVARPTPGIPKFINVGLTDAVKPNMESDPFYVRVGVCYTNKNGSHPQSPKFRIHRGYKSWGGNGTTYDDPLMRRYFNKLNNLWDGQTCDNLDYQVLDNTRRNDLGCPADGVVIRQNAKTCPTGSVPGTKQDSRGQDVCIFETDTLDAETDFSKLANPDGTPVVMPHPKYHYDATTGMLFFYVMQKEPNAQGSSPIGSCVNGSDPACPDATESLFACPAQGCITYTVEIDDDSYDPGASSCAGSTSPGEIYKVQNGKYVLPEPVNANKLGYAPPYPAGVDEKTFVVADDKKSAQGFDHRVPRVAPTCTGTP